MQLTEYLNEAMALASQGFDTVNSIQGLVIAVIAAGMMRSYGQIIVYAIGATVIHEIVTIVRHIAMHDGTPMPNFADPAELKLIAIRLVGYFVAITVIYLIRRVLIRS
jgi:hypothetical protein